MKKSRFLEIVREEIQKQLSEYGSESMYYGSPGGFEQMGRAREMHVQRFESFELWKITAMQLGAIVQDRGDDYIAVMPNQDKIGTFGKMNQFVTLSL